MAVYFVYRCHYGAPSEKHVRRFEYDTVLDWAKATWAQFDDDTEAAGYAEQTLGVPFLYDLFYTGGYGRTLTPRPRSMADVVEWLNMETVVGGYRDSVVQEESHGPHHVQLRIQQDDWSAAVYVFDDRYRAKKPGKADFLLLDGWELPDGSSDGPVPELPNTDLRARVEGGEGTVYVVGLAGAGKYQARYDLRVLVPAERIEGTRLPTLARHILVTPEYDSFSIGWIDPPKELCRRLKLALKAPKGADAGFLKAIRKQPAELTHWCAYSDWLQDRDLPPSGVHLIERALRVKGPRSALNHVKVTTHMAQACLHTHEFQVAPEYRAGGWAHHYCQLIFFDDRWAAAHPTLAAGILTFASRWDVLS